MLFVVGVAQLPQQLRVCRGPAAILGRTRAVARQTTRIACLRVGIRDCFDDDAMLPAVPEIILEDEMILRTRR